MKTVVSTLLLAALVSGCAVDGKAVEAHFWDPCTELSDEALREAGARPETKDDAVQFPKWHMCGWRTDSEPFFVNVYSTEWRLADFRRNPTKSKFRDVRVLGRSGLEYREVSNPANACTVGFDTARGSVHVEIGAVSGGSNFCDRAAEMAGRLLKSLPR